MEQKDFDRLKAICEKEGFEVDGLIRSDDLVWIRPKRDIWEGVDFGLLVSPVGNNMEVGKIYKLGLLNDIGRKIWIREKFIVPSTEQAYVDQLEKEVYKRFGDINQKDKFIEPDGRNHTFWFNLKGYVYDKKDDVFRYHDLVLYQAGKWATKLPKRIEVKNWSYMSKEKGGKIYHECVFICPIEEFTDDLHIFLTSQLEKYLNGEIE